MEFRRTGIITATLPDHEFNGDSLTITGKGSITINYKEIRRIKEQNNKLIAALNPRQWTQTQIDAWHKNLPDTQKAFDSLKETILAEEGG